VFIEIPQTSITKALSCGSPAHLTAEVLQSPGSISTFCPSSSGQSKGGSFSVSPWAVIGSNPVTLCLLQKKTSNHQAHSCFRPRPSQNQERFLASPAEAGTILQLWILPHLSWQIINVAPESLACFLAVLSSQLFNQQELNVHKVQRLERILFYTKKACFWFVRQVSFTEAYSTCIQLILFSACLQSGCRSTSIWSGLYS